MTRKEANEMAERDLEKLIEEIRWGIMEALQSKLDGLRSEGEAKELLFIRAAKEALKCELRVARLGSLLETGYRTYVQFLRSKETY